MLKVRTEFEKPLRYKKADWGINKGAKYYVKGRKKPVAYSTNAELDTLNFLSESMSLLEIAELHNFGLWKLTEGEIKVIEVLISFGETDAKRHVDKSELGMYI